MSTLTLEEITAVLREQQLHATGCDKLHSLRSRAEGYGVYLEDCTCYVEN